MSQGVIDQKKPQRARSYRFHFTGIAIAAAFSALFAARSFAGCVESMTERPPFYLMSASTLRSEVFQLLQSQYETEGAGKISGQPILDDEFGRATQTRYIERGSVVESLVEFDSNAGTQALVPVKVLTAAAPRLKGWRREASVSKGDTGFLDPTVLRAAGKNHVFVVREDALLPSFPGWTESTLRAGSVIKPKMKDGKYLVLQCDADEGAKPRISYLFDSVPSPNADGTLQDAHKTFAMPFDLSCVNLMGLLQNQFEGLSKVAKAVARLYKKNDPLQLKDLEMNDWGFVRLPTRPTNDGSDITEVSLDGSFVHFQGGDPVGSDTWASPHTACSLMKIAKEWKESVCPLKNKEECALQVGDIAFATPGMLKGVRRDPLGHGFHSSGQCIDLRPFRKDRNRIPLNLQTDAAAYDRDVTEAFIAFLIRKKASPIYFNDPSIYRDSKLGFGSQPCNLEDSFLDRGHKVQPCGGHDNHIHFCLLSGDTEGC